MPRKNPVDRSQPAAYLNTGGSTTHSRGYILELCPGHPACDKDGYVEQHRLVMERHLGRYLSGIEVVHHEDEVKSHNDLDNLRLFANQAEHMRYHQRKKALCYNPEVIEAVRRAAADPSVRTTDLPWSNVTVNKICRAHGIEWIAPNQRYLTEDQVRNALVGRTTLEAAKFLGCHHMTLRSRFDHLLKKRKSPTPRIPKAHGGQRGELGIQIQ